MDSSRIRLGLVGAGSHARRNILPAITFLPAQIVAIADTDAARAGAVASEYGARAFSDAMTMYESGEIDAVLLCVSPNAHPDLAIQAFGAGLDVWSEKPAATASADVERMIAARGDRVGMVGYKKAFMPAVSKAIELLGRDDEGPLRSALGLYPVQLPYFAEPPFPVTGWLTSGCHPVSLLRAVGGPVVSVTSHRDNGGGGVCIMRHASGALTNLHLSLGAPKFQPCERYLFVTDRHSIEIDNGRRLTFQRGFDVAYDEDFTFAPPGLDGGAIVWEAQDTMATMQGKSEVTQGIYNELLAFCTAVRTRENPAVGSLEFALDVTRIYEAALLSDGTPISL
ncbi:Gfo/Idh/MocA family protein [Gryllotalpicola protaetiae]|uniref:Gfo/Idh/MocA family protein n=1 Tax=Gryllotalpicola protaetiae TaxID=2419771 RepID=UPI0013C52B87|nr:Gfo/Idh/MocA family oxidoreductase [Gryllotalpicola protaetiae]